MTRGRSSLWFSYATTALGLVMVCAWVFEAAAVKRPHLAWAPMKFNAALCFVASGLSLAFSGSASARRRAASYLLAAFVLAMGLVNTLEHALGVNLGIDELFFSEPPMTGFRLLPPGRMAPSTAIDFVFMGLCLFGLRARGVIVRGTQLLALVILFTTLPIFGSHLYGASLRQGVAFYTQMAFLTAVGFVALALGVLSSSTMTGVVAELFRPTAGGLLGRRVLPIILLVPLCVGWLVLQGHQRGYYDAPYALCLAVVGCSILLALVLLLSVGSLNAVDSQRLEAVRALEAEAECVSLLQIVTEAANEAQSVESIMKECVELICRFSSWQVGHVFIVDEGGALMSTDIWFGQSEQHFDAFKAATARERFTGGVGTPGRVAESKRPILIPNVVKDARFTRSAAAEAAGLKSAFAFPVLVHREVVAVLEFFSADEKTYDQAFIDVSANIGIQLGRVVERKRTEAMVRASEEHFHRLADAIPQIVWTARPDGWLDYYNNKWFEYTGLTLAQTQGWGWKPVIHPDDLSRSVELWTRSVKTGEVYQIEYRFKRADGQYRWHLGRATPVRDAGGTIIKWFGTGTDIDDQKRAQEALSQSLEALKQAREEKTLLLAREQAALEASRLKSEFLANMSHEIRTPMNGVIGMSNILLETELTSAQREYVQVMHHSAEALLTVINDVLDLSKIEAGKLALEEIPFEPVTLVREVTSLLLPSFTAKGIALNVHFADDLPSKVHGDAHRLRQVLTNLLANAVKFTERGEVSVRVTKKGGAGGEVDLGFEIQDTGIGIPPDARSRIFELFSQADNSTTRKYGGTGLGLSICRRLVEMMGGAIDFASDGVSGTIFFFHLRLKVVEDAGAMAATRTAAGAEGTGSVRVLLAEDNAVNQMVAKAMLQKLGCHVDIVGDGQLAISALVERSYDLILMDCQMPNLDGYAASRIIRAQLKPPLSQIPIIAMTAHAMAGDREQCLAAGMNDYISKPVDFAVLATAIQRWAPVKKVKVA